MGAGIGEAGFLFVAISWRLYTFSARLGKAAGQAAKRRRNGHAIIGRTLAPILIDPAYRRDATTWLARGLLFVATVLLLEHARPLLLPVAIALVFTFVLAAPVRALQRAGVHEYIGAGLVIAAVLGVAVLLLMLVAAPAAAWWARAPLIVHELVDALQRWRDALFPYATPAPLIRAPSLAASPDLLGERLASEGWIFTRLAIGETISFALSASATVILLYFLLASERWLVSRTIAAIRRPRMRALVLAGVRQAQRDIGLFISTMSLVNVALGVATGLALWLIGLPNPVLWGTTTAVLAFIPYLGPLLITLLLLLAGSVTFGTGFEMLGPPAAFLLLHGIEANFLSPMIMGHRLRLRPVFVFLSVMVWGWLWGIAGAFLAVPLLLALRALCKRTRTLRLVCVYLEGD
jgi:predicted PurR-regulated permease PerM